MIDKHGRVTITRELLKRQYKIRTGDKVNIYFDFYQNALILKPVVEKVEGKFFIKSVSMDSKNRIFLPEAVKRSFDGCGFLPAEKDGDIYILIIDHKEKSE